MPMNARLIEPDWPAPANVVALTTLRSGGCSSAPFASLNLAAHVGDDPRAVRANREILHGWLPADTRIQWLDQVHGCCAIHAGGDGPPAVADASWTRAAGMACAVLTADCLPVLLCARDGSAVAAAHAGWRGLLAGVLESAVAAAGIDPRELLAWLGPAIGPAAFEVGPEVRSAFLAASDPGQRQPTRACFAPSPDRPGHYLADLYALARLRLRALGPVGIFGGGLCTVADSDRFFSFRRDGRTGRMASVILRRTG